MSLFEKKETAKEASPAGKGVKDLLSRHSSRKGAYSAGVVALAVIAVLVFNLIVGQLPASKTQIDLTGSKIYNITQTSKDYLSKMDKDVQIHVLADKDSVDSRIVRFLDKYVSLSKHLTLDYINPTVYPSALTTYNADANTIVVACKDTGRQQTINISDIIGYDQMAYLTSQQYTETSFDAEGLLTSAIDGVLTQSTRKAYETTGHDESAMPTDVESRLNKVHMSVKTVNLLTDGGIPKDCDLLVINDPSKDLANDELSMIETYLAGGGQVIYCMASKNLSLPNFEKLCADYGLNVVSGMIGDTQRYYMNNASLFFPVVDNSVDAASSITSDATLLFYASRGMTVGTPVRSTITVSPFLSTSSGGVAMVDQDHQTQGTYVVGAVATEKIDDSTTARFTVYGADSLINSNITSSFTNVENTDLFVASATVGFKDISSISIAPVSLSEEYNTVTTGGLWGILFILVIPMGVLAAGFVRWVRRRKL